MKRITVIVTAAVLAGTAIFCGCSKKTDVSSNLPEKAATSDEPATETTVNTTGNKVHINDSTLGEIWITELEGVAKNTLAPEGFTADANFKYYSENGKAASLEGIDISSFCGDIDWKKVKAAGVDFVMVRLGGRTYGETGELYRDDRAVEYIKGAQAEGIKAGGYFFSQATTTSEAVEEADFSAEILGDVKLDFPLAYDWEIIKDDNARTDKVTSAQATECARAFCQQAASYGYTPMVYAPSRELYFKYDLTRLTDADIWYVEYSNTPNFYYRFSMWQYSENGKVDGIEGTVDLDICFTNVAEYIN